MHLPHLRFFFRCICTHYRELGSSTRWTEGDDSGTAWRCLEATQRNWSSTRPNWKLLCLSGATAGSVGVRFESMFSGRRVLRLKGRLRMRTMPPQPHWKWTHVQASFHLCWSPVLQVSSSSILLIQFFMPLESETNRGCRKNSIKQ